MFRWIVAALCALAVASTAQAQVYRPGGFAPGFRAGFQFLGMASPPPVSSIPVANWRLPITGAVVDSVGDSATQIAIQNSSANKRDATFTLSANQARTFTVPVAAVTDPGGLLYLSSYIQDSYIEDPTTASASSVQQSFDNGTTWSDLTVAQGSKLDRGLAWHLASGAARLVRFTVTAGSSACTGSVGLRQRPSSGIADIILIEGPSFEDRGYKPYQVLNVLNSLFPGQDPMVFNQGYAGQNSQQIRTRTQTDLPNFPLATMVVVNQGGNTVTATRPYSAGNSLALALHTEVATMIQAVLDAGRTPLVQGISYRDYPSPNPVNQNANPENGSLPYNINEVYSSLQLKAPDQFNGALSVPNVDTYAYFLRDPSILSGDGVHPYTVAGYRGLITYQFQNWGAKVYGATGPPSVYEQAVSAAESGKTQALVNTAQTLLNVLAASSTKTALQNRLNAVVVPVSAPGQVVSLSPGTSTSTSQPLTWTAPSSGGAPTSYLMEYRTTAGPGAWTSGGTSTTTSGTVSSLSAGTSYDYRVTASNSAGSGTASATVTASTAAAAATLQALTLSPTTATAGSAYSGTISGKTSGSTITATSSDGTTMTVSGTTVTGTFSAAGTPTVTLAETLAGATNTPRSSTVSLTVSAAVTTRKFQLKPFTTAANASGLSDWSDANVANASSTATQVAIRDTSGAATGLGVYVTLTGGAGVLDNSQSAPNPNAYPQAVAKSFLYISQGTLTLNITGFKANASVPSVNVLSSRGAGTTRTSVLTANGTQKTINSSNNTTLLSFSNLTADANGVLAITLGVGSPNDGVFAYLNALDVTYAP